MIINMKNLDYLFYVDDKNRSYGEFLLDYLYNSKNIARQYKNDLYKSIYKYFEVSTEVATYFKEFDLKNNIYILDKEEYENNPYNKNIILNNVIDGDYKFKYENYLPYEGFLFDEINNDENQFEISKIGYFKQEYKYLTLSYKDNIWMLITPHEINTMKKAIDEASGNVITFGLGLGYFAYMCSLKENVNTITIIEKDSKIIELFKKHILVKFKHKEKIIIINDDALSYINNKSFNYDYAFVDLWRDTNDGLFLYVKMYQESLKKKNTKFSYWIENSFIAILKRCMINVIYESMYEVIETDEQSFYDYIVNRFKELTKDYIINNKEDINKLLSKEYLKTLLEYI